MVPAVTDISYRQRSQSQRFRRIDQASAPAHRGHTQPPGQRSAARYSAQASSLLKRLSSSSKVRGKSSSMTPKSTYWGWWRQVNTPNSILTVIANSHQILELGPGHPADPGRKLFESTDSIFEHELRSSKKFIEKER